MYLLDTNVVSEIRKIGSNRIDANVANWAYAHEHRPWYISTITILEIEMGILRIERHDAAQSALLRQWFEQQLIPAFNGKILAFTSQMALQCARLHIPERKPERDAMIAATALEQELTLVSRNIKDFEKINLTVINPWQRVERV